MAPYSSLTLRQLPGAYGCTFDQLNDKCLQFCETQPVTSRSLQALGPPRLSHRMISIDHMDPSTVLFGTNQRVTVCLQRRWRGNNCSRHLARSTLTYSQQVAVPSHEVLSCSSLQRAQRDSCGLTPPAFRCPPMTSTPYISQWPLTATINGLSCVPETFASGTFKERF